MGRGSRRLTTAWIPWHDVPLRTGGVAVVDRSHSLPGFSRVRQTYGEQEVHGMLSSDPLECIAFDPAARWLTADYRAGDVLAFPMDLLHGSCTNRNDAAAPLRLSSDIRFQPRSEPVDDRNTAHGADEPDYTWDESNGYHLGESFSSKESQSAPPPPLPPPPSHSSGPVTSSARACCCWCAEKRPGLGAPEYRGRPVPASLEDAKREWGIAQKPAL